MNTPNWILANKCSKVINKEKRIAWDIKGKQDGYFGCQFCDPRIQKKCLEFNWASWINENDLEWEKENVV